MCYFVHGTCSAAPGLFAGTPAAWMDCPLSHRMDCSLFTARCFWLLSGTSVSGAITLCPWHYFKSSGLKVLGQSGFNSGPLLHLTRVS